jgi:NAD(P)-dependent dehydrogenase (short-subunit alcohol dehydrogenase family)
MRNLRRLRLLALAGSITFVGSMTSALAGLADVVAYACAKSGLLGLCGHWPSSGPTTGRR